MLGLVSAGVGLLSQGFKFFSGASQKREAKKLAANNRLEAYARPGEVTKATKLAEDAYRNGNPMEGRALAQAQRVSSNAYAQASSGAMSSNDLLDSVNRIQQNENLAVNEVMYNSAMYGLQASQGYQRALLNEATYADKEYQLNQLDPYIRKANAAASMYGAGQTNMSSALDGVANIGMGLATSFGTNKILNGGNSSSQEAGIFNAKDARIKKVLPGYSGGFDVPIQAAASQAAKYSL